MSRGVGGWAKVIFEDDILIKYEYGSYDWNRPEYYNDEKIRDGSITVYKQNIPEKLRENLAEFLKSSSIEIVNCSKCWHTIENHDFVALSLLAKIAREYDEKHEFPDYMGLHT